ncbi:MAG TPA: hypothetical protein VFX85_12835 [Solirubrobacterales bacterium]|nr:hypothetical protein [Solirubrobacterales bacterium]
MAVHRLIVFSAPTPGKEDEYNDWYNNIHLAEVIEIPGFVAAQRFRLSDEQLPGFQPSPHKYLSIYEFDRPPGEPLETLRQLLESNEIGLPDSIQIDSICPWAYSSISERAAATQ